MFTVIALNDNTTTSGPTKIQIIDSLSGSAFSTSGGAETQISGNLDVTPTRTGTQTASHNTIQSIAGIYSTSNDGPINLTVANGDTLFLGYGVSITSAVYPNGPVPQSANGGFDAMLGYIAPPGWGLYIENADGTPGRELHEFPAVPEASTTVSFGLLLVMGFGGLLATRRKRVNA